MLIKEFNIVKKNWREVDLKFALCYPSVYRVGMTCLAVHLLYELLNMRRNVLCERVFFEPYFNMRSVESNRVLSDFDVVGFSLQYEVDYVNFVRMLLSSNIPVYSRDRDDSHPIVIAGGPAVSSNPEPVAPLVDAIVIGELEPIIDDILNVFIDSEDRDSCLDELMSIRGVYVPRNIYPVKRSWVKSLDDAHHAVAQIIPQVRSSSRFSPIFGRAFLLEVTRGCKWACKFCLEGFNYRPFRERSLHVIEEILDEGLRRTGVDKIVIIGSDASDHSELEDICEYIVSSGLKISISSMRAKVVDEKIIKLLVKGGQRTLTLAPETGSESLRHYIGKFLSNQDVINAAKIAYSCGIRNIKLYFIVGLPNETEDDIKSIFDLARRVADVGFSFPRSVRLTVSIFIPKAHTPFQWYGLEDPSILRSRIKLLRRLCAGDRRIELRVMRLREAVIQAFLSRAGREAASLIVDVAKFGGSLSAWRRAEKIAKISIEREATSVKSLEDYLPWGHIEVA